MQVAYGSNANTYIPGEEQGGGCTGEGGAKQVAMDNSILFGVTYSRVCHNIISNTHARNLLFKNNQSQAMMAITIWWVEVIQD